MVFIMVTAINGSMRILCTTDIHGRLGVAHRLAEKAPTCDLIVVAGDITNFGDWKKAEEVLGMLKKINDAIVAVPGNCDLKGVNDYLAEMGMSIHGRGRTIDDIGFFGAGGSNTTPFDTPQEYSEDELARILAKGFRDVKDAAKKVMVCHPPPYATKLDATGAGLHVGSRGARDFLDKNKVDVVITGHIHEARGEDHLGDTMLLNPGPLHMGYALLEISAGKTAKVDFHAL